MVKLTVTPTFWRQADDEPLSEPLVVKFTDTNMRKIILHTFYSTSLQRHSFWLSGSIATTRKQPQIAKIMWPTFGPPGSGPMLVQHVLGYKTCLDTKPV